jgi:hypothetical protein
MSGDEAKLLLNGFESVLSPINEKNVNLQMVAALKCYAPAQTRDFIADEINSQPLVPVLRNGAGIGGSNGPKTRL